MPGPNSIALSLEQVITMVRSDAKLAAQKRRELCSAVTTFCRICGRHSSEVIADPGAIRALSKDAPWLLAGYTKKSWANTMSRLRRALEVAGVKVHRQRRNFALTPEWQHLLSSCCKRDHDELHRFAGWCSTFGTQPQNVSPDIFEQFYAYLNEQMTQRNPRERGHVARRAWNRLVETTPGLHPAPAPQSADIKTLPWDVFPMSLQGEVAAYREKMLAPSLSDANHRPLKPVTISNYLTRIRVLLTALVEAGTPIERFQSLHDVVDPEMVKHGLQHRLGERPLDDRSRMDLHSIATAALSISRAIGVEQEARQHLKVLAGKVRYTARGMNKKNTQRLRPLLAPAVTKIMLDLPSKVMAEIGLPDCPSVRQVQRAQMAVLLELLLHVPLRIRNAAELVLGETIMPPLAGTQGRWQLSIPSHDVKNDEAVNAELDETLGRLLDTYVEAFRPVLLQQPNRRLFLSQTGGGKGASALSKQFSAFLLREAGLVVHAHLMRHFAAHLYLLAHPGEYEVVRRLLGHKSIDTTVRMYTGLEDAAAFARYDQIIDHMRTPGEDQL